MGRIAALVPEFAVKDLPLGRTLMMMIYGIYNMNDINIMDQNTRWIHKGGPH